MTENTNNAELEAEGYNAEAIDGDGDGTVQDGTKFERPEETANLEKGKDKKKPAAQPQQAIHVVSGKDKDDVFLKQCVYKNRYARKSLTVHHVQRRLAELGFTDAASDRDGWYGDLTKRAVEQYQEANKFPVTGKIDEQVFTKLFAGDPNVNINV